MIIVYEATNLVNGKRYIGVTKKTLRRRISDHFHRANSPTRRQTRFSNAIRKYGEESFYFIVRSLWENYQDALKEEMRLIATESPQYNITIGGDSIRIADRKSHGDWYKKVSASLKGRKPTELAKQQSRIANAAKARVAVCINDGATGTIAELSAKYGIRKNSIRCVCNGEWSNTHGMCFSWDTSLSRDPALVLQRIEETQNKLLAHRQSLGRARRKKVIHIPSGRIFESQASAAIHYGCSHSRISQLCTGNSQVFAFVEGTL